MFLYLPFLSNSTRQLAASRLRNVLGTKTLAEIISLEGRESLCNSIQNSLDKAASSWGVRVERVKM